MEPSPALATTSQVPLATPTTALDSPRACPPAPPVPEPVHAVAAPGPNGRALPSPPLPRLPPVASAVHDSVGTAENPLIPKRRRRTSPTELAILEQEYTLNQRPDQPERARIAQRLGMTNRAIQVWYQNRRQKDKKDTSSNAGSCRGSSVASGDLSSPKDLDGITLSFSSSPVPSPKLPLYTSAAPSRPPLVATSSTFSLKALPSSSDLYSTTAPIPSSHKENAPVSPVDGPPKPYVYSYPASKEDIAAIYQLAKPPSAPSSATSSRQDAVFVHRASDSSIIAAKKHVRKRPLGSHAPVARTPSLSHAFDFPPSPPKPQAAPRAASVGCSAPTTAAQISLAHLTARRPEFGRTATSSSHSSSLFNFGEKPVQREASSGAAGPSQQGEEVGRRDGSDDGRKAAADDLLQHMQSDPPSASSPAPITRTRTFTPSGAVLATADEESDDDDKASGSFVPSAFASRRPPLQHTQSLGAPQTQARGVDNRGGDPSKAKARVALLRSNSYSGSSSSPSSSSPLTISPSLANAHARSNPFSPMSAPLSSRTVPGRSPSLSQATENARAGTDNACALTALEHKRAKIISDSLPHSLPSLPALPSSSGNSRRRSQDPVKDRATKRRRSSALSTVSTSNHYHSHHYEAGDESMGDLSFSSTSTASTVDSLATVDDSPPPRSSGSSSAAFPGGYFALKTAVEQVEGGDKLTAADDERECAELLLGLGGFF
ncbi:hypothetical protein JCM11491_004998 [Sporobolomyces phaffii]